MPTPLSPVPERRVRRSSVADRAPLPARPWLQEVHPLAGTPTKRSSPRTRRAEVAAHARLTTAAAAAGGGVLAAAVTWIAVHRQVRFLRRLLGKALNEARRDPLTGLPNRTAALEALTRGPVALVGLLDLDDFKAVNDRHGHRVGDQVLTVLAGRLRTAMAGRGIAARLSGDEFVLLWHHSPAGDDLGHVEALLRHLRAPIRIDGHHLSVAASLGLARPSPFLQGSDLLAAADSAMYAAKHASRTASSSAYGQAPSSARIHAGPHPPTPRDRRTTRRGDRTPAPGTHHEP